MIRLPGKAAKQPVMIQTRTFESVGWSKDVLRFHESNFSVKNPGETIFEHLPPGQYCVDRYQQTPTGKKSVLITASDRQLVKIESNQRASAHFDRKVGRPLVGRVRGLENVKLRYAHVSIVDAAPDIVLQNVATGKQIKLSSLRGKVVCLEFWATWCGPCQPAMAKLNRLSAERSAAWKDRVILISVSIDTAVDRVKSHVSSRGWDRVDHFWTGDKTGTGWDAPAARAFGVLGVPETILIGPDGRILWRGHPESKSGGHDLKSRIESELVK